MKVKTEGLEFPSPLCQPFTLASSVIQHPKCCLVLRGILPVHESFTQITNNTLSPSTLKMKKRKKISVFKRKNPALSHFKNGHKFIVFKQRILVSQASFSVDLVLSFLRVYLDKFLGASI